MNFNNLVLLEPWYLLLLPLYYLIKWQLLKRGAAAIFSNVELLNRVYRGGFNYAKLLEFLIVLLISLAASNLAIKDKLEQKSIQGHSIAMLLDASSSMSEQNRFAIAKEVVESFLTKREGDELALILFANYAYVASPLTYDKSSLKQMLKHIKLGIAGSRGTALYEAIYQSSKLFKGKKNRVAILLSDGIDSVGSVSQQEALKRAKEAKIRFYTIGLGEAGDIDSKFLKELANSSGGKFYISANAKELSRIYQEINSLEKSKIKSSVELKYRYLSIYFIVAALILLLLLATMQSLNIALSIGVFVALILSIFTPSFSSHFESVDGNKKLINIALDVSNFMEAEDIYPNRLEFAKAKIIKSLKELKGQRVALYVYANRAYLITPPTDDYSRLEYAIKHLDLKNIKRNKSNILALLRAIKSNLITITSGDNYSSYQDEKAYINKEGIELSIYAVGTKEGGVLKLNGANGELDVVSLNRHLKDLANNYLQATPSNSLSSLIKSAESGASKVLNIDNNRNKFALLLALMLLLFAVTKRGEL